MKVLHLISGGDVGGAKVQVITLVKALQKQNINVRIICFLEGIFYDEAVEAGLDIQLIKQVTRFDFTVLKNIRQAIDNEGFQLVHAHGARANMLAMLLKVDVPVITTIHSDYLLDFDDTLYKKLFFTPLNILALKRMDHYITISPELKQIIVERGFPAEKTSFVFNGLDFDMDINYGSPAEFYAKRGINYDSQTTYVGILARLHPVKGHKVLLEGAAAVLKKVDNVKFVIGGDGSEKENLRRLAKKLQIDQHVHFVGFIQNPYEFLNAIDINVLTSHSETFPYALLEGARMKKPSISSAVGGIPNLIIDGQTGFLFPPGDAQGLAEKLEKMLLADDKGEKFGQALYQYGREKYSSTAMAKQFVEIYQKVVQNEV